MASLIGWLLGPAVVAGALLVAFTLYRTGFIGGRIFVTMPLIGFAASGGYGLAVAVFAPSVRSPDATLALTVVAFAFGALAISTYSVLPVLGANRHIAPVLARYWHFVVVAHAQGAVCLLGFLLLAVLGLA